MSESLEFSGYSAPQARRKVQPARFVGKYEHKVAERSNQVAFPKTFLTTSKESQEGNLVLVKIPKECYCRIYTDEAFDRSVAVLEQKAIAKGEEPVTAVRRLSKHSQSVEPDQQGR